MARWVGVCISLGVVLLLTVVLIRAAGIISDLCSKSEAVVLVFNLRMWP